MIHIPEPKHKVPERLKSDTWAFHVLSRSDDPAVQCKNINNLVRNIKTSVDLADISNEIVFDVDFNINVTISQFLEYQIRGANEAWKHYTLGNTGKAVEIANAVLNKLLPFVYNEQFTTSQSNSFTIKPQVKT